MYTEIVGFDGEKNVVYIQSLLFIIINQKENKSNKKKYI